MAQTETGKTGDAKPLTAGKTPLLNREIKDTVFSDLFSSKKNLLALYRVFHPEDKTATENDVSNVTMKNILMRDLYNDLGFTVRGKLLLLVEAQSTWTVNVIFRLFLYLAETWGEYVKVTEQNIYGTKKITLPQTEAYVIFTGDRKGKPETISLFEEFGASLARNSSSPLERNLVSLAPDERMIELKAKVIFSDEDTESGGIGENEIGKSGKRMDILQQYIAFSKEADRQFKEKERTVQALTAAIEICKRKNVLREYLQSREKEVVKIMTMLFDQGYVNDIALKEREAIGEYNKAISTARNFLAMGLLSVEQIAQGTGLSVEEVKSLRWCSDAEKAKTASKRMDILQQYIAFSKEADKQFKEKGRTVQALTAAIKICKRKNVLREYLESREKEVVKIMTIQRLGCAQPQRVWILTCVNLQTRQAQGYVNDIALKESVARRWRA